MKNAVIYFLVFAIGMISGLGIYKMMLAKNEIVINSPVSLAKPLTHTFAEDDFDNYIYVVGKSASGKCCLTAFPTEDVSAGTGVLVTYLNALPTLASAVQSLSTKKDNVFITGSDLLLKSRIVHKYTFTSPNLLVSKDGMLDIKDEAGKPTKISVGRIVSIDGSTGGGVVVGYVDLNDIDILPLNSTK